MHYILPSQLKIICPQHVLLCSWCFPFMDMDISLWEKLCWQNQTSAKSYICALEVKTLTVRMKGWRVVCQSFNQKRQPFLSRFNPKERGTVLFPQAVYCPSGIPVVVLDVLQQNNPHSPLTWDFQKPLFQSFWTPNLAALSLRIPAPQTRRHIGGSGSLSRSSIAPS